MSNNSKKVAVPKNKTVRKFIPPVKTVRSKPKNERLNTIKEAERVLRASCEPFIVHRQTETPRPYSIAAIVKGNKLKVGYAVCGELDSFSRREGRWRAMQRAVETPIVELPLPKRTPNDDEKSYRSKIGKKVFAFATDFCKDAEHAHLFDRELGIKVAKEAKK